MKKIKETPKLIIYQEKLKDRVITYRLHKEDESKEKVKIFEQQGNKFKYSFEGASILSLELEGFKEIPEEIISVYGYGFKDKTLSNFFRYKLETNLANKLVISTTKSSSLKGTSIILNVKDVAKLQNHLNQEQRACNDIKNTLIRNFFSEKYPSLEFEFRETNNNKELVLRNLNSKLIDKLTAEDVEFLGDFYVKAATKYKRPDVVKKMVLNLQKNSQILSLQEIVNKYEKLIKENPAERVWQKFFEEYISLFDNRYVQQINYKNIAVGLTKYPDLVLADIYGYIDFYELKKSGLKTLQYDSSHKTYFWSKDVSMAIAQSADYIQKSKENSLSYAKTIKEETATEDSPGLVVNVISPRVILVAGTSSEFNTEKKRNHFKNLRESLKDIEFVLYDELLDRLKNLLSQVENS